MELESAGAAVAKSLKGARANTTIFEDQKHLTCGISSSAVVCQEWERTGADQLEITAANWWILWLNIKRNG